MVVINMSLYMRNGRKPCEMGENPIKVGFLVNFGHFRKKSKKSSFWALSDFPFAKQQESKHVLEEELRSE